jgi:hypothetical protein
MKLERNFGGKTQMETKKFLETPHKNGATAEREGGREGGREWWYNIVLIKVLIYFMLIFINKCYLRV